ncbi:MAG: hypothetical protein H7305_03885 [Gemmatimonadaceae bacterium]|nr:hypothetical protein [Gemmatimonadaceae bacterium]
MGHGKHAGHSVAMFRDKFWISVVLTIPTLVWGHMLRTALGYTAPSFPGVTYFPAFFGTAVFCYGGLTFLKGAVQEIRDRRPGMMVLIALAISAAFGFSAAVLFGFPGPPLWEELASVVTIMLLGHWLEMRSVSQAQGALGELAKLLPDTATRVTGSGATETLDEVAVTELHDGDVLLVRSDPRDVARIITLSRASYRKMLQNSWRATGYNVIAIPLAAGVLALWGLTLTPAMAVGLMSLSTIIVAASAQLLRRAKR